MEKKTLHIKQILTKVYFNLFLKPLNENVNYFLTKANCQMINLSNILLCLLLEDYN